MNVCMDVMLVITKSQCHVNDRILLFFQLWYGMGCPTQRIVPTQSRSVLTATLPSEGTLTRLANTSQTGRQTMCCSAKWDLVQSEVGSGAV